MNEVLIEALRGLRIFGFGMNLYGIASEGKPMRIIILFIQFLRTS